MRPGVEYEPGLVAGVDGITPGETFTGFELVYDAKLPDVAEVRSALWEPYIALGPRWFELYRMEQLAVLWHEVGHIMHEHMLIRIALIPVFWTDFARRVAQRQELQADEYAVDHGYGRGMLQFLSRVYRDNGFRENHADDFHPSIVARIKNLIHKEYAHANPHFFIQTS